MAIFKELVNALTPILKPMGFSKKRNSFYIKSGQNYGIINFQKSRESTTYAVKFTINFGVFSNVLSGLQYDYDSSTKPEVEQCHWGARIGDFMPDSPDYWWNISTSVNLSGVISEVMGTLQSIVMPEINKRLSDEGLINNWMNESFAGTTEIGRFRYLTTLLMSKADIDTLGQVVETFMQKSKGKPNGSMAIEHLKYIEYRN